MLYTNVYDYELLTEKIEKPSLEFYLIQEFILFLLNKIWKLLYR